MNTLKVVITAEVDGDGKVFELNLEQKFRDNCAMADVQQGIVGGIQGAMADYRASLQADAKAGR